MPALHKKGDKVTIYQLSHSRGLMVEGTATIRKVLDPDGDMEHYMVKFDKDRDRSSYERFVDREGQEMPPEQYIEMFNARLGIKAA